MEASKIYLQLFEQEIAILRAKDSMPNKLLRLYDDEIMRQNLVMYYNKMSEEDKLYVAVTYGIPENRS